MTTQQKVGLNVLEVLRDDFVDASLTRMHDKDAHAKATRSEDALAAVAELIEADKEYDAAKKAWENAPGNASAIGDTDGRDYDGPEYARWRAAIARRASALARVGGAA